MIYTVRPTFMKSTPVYLLLFFRSTTSPVPAHPSSWVRPATPLTTHAWSNPVRTGVSVSSPRTREIRATIFTVNVLKASTASGARTTSTSAKASSAPTTRSALIWYVLCCVLCNTEHFSASHCGFLHQNAFSLNRWIFLHSLALHRELDFDLTSRIQFNYLAKSLPLLTYIVKCKSLVLLIVCKLDMSLQSRILRFARFEFKFLIDKTFLLTGCESLIFSEFFRVSILIFFTFLLTGCKLRMSLSSRVCRRQLFS